MSAVFLAVLQAAGAVAIAPVVVGVMRQVRARMEGRAGAGVGQPWRDLRKLFVKEPLQAAGVGPAQVWAPLVLVVSSLVLCSLVPALGVASSPLLPDDLFVVVSVLLVGTVALALLGLASGSAFGGMGSSRHMMIAALVEPTVLLAVYALSIPVGTSSLSAIIAARVDHPGSLVAPAGLLGVVALAVVALAETGRLPVDNPSTHLELTMIHEAMVLESGGRDLAWLELGSWLRFTALLALVVDLVVPWGIATTAGAGALIVGAVTVTVKLLAAAAAVAAVEVFAAKLRLFRIPELLAGSFVLAFLAVAVSSLTA